MWGLGFLNFTSTHCSHIHCLKIPSSQNGGPQVTGSEAPLSQGLGPSLGLPLPCHKDSTSAPGFCALAHPSSTSLGPVQAILHLTTSGTTQPQLSPSLSLQSL